MPNVSTATKKSAKPTKARPKSPPAQQELLRNAKEALSLTWDELADQSGITPRALKTYRMPETSQDYRAMPNLARRAIEQLLG